MELEARIGKMDERNKWQNGVSRRFFNAVLAVLEPYGSWSQSTDWVDVHDYFYTLPSTNTVVRTSMFLNPMRVEHIAKVQHGHVNLHIAGHPYDVRVALKGEDPVEAGTLPSTASPHYVRIKKRRVFALPHWKFELTQVWSGASRSAAEEHQAHGAPTYEIEVEFRADAPVYLDTHSDVYIGTSLLLKICNLVGDSIPEITLL
jgi:hypothetical protein